MQSNCEQCGKPYYSSSATLSFRRASDGRISVKSEEICQCFVTKMSTSTIGFFGPYASPYVPQSEPEDDDPMECPGILADLDAMRVRAARVLDQRRHKDLDGETAHQLAADVLALCDALEEAFEDAD